MKSRYPLPPPEERSLGTDDEAGQWLLALVDLDRLQEKHLVGSKAFGTLKDRKFLGETLPVHQHSFTELHLLGSSYRKLQLFIAVTSSVGVNSVLPRSLQQRGDKIDEILLSRLWQPSKIFSGRSDSAVAHYFFGTLFDDFGQVDSSSDFIFAGRTHEFSHF